MPSVNVSRIVDRVNSTFWVVPAFCVVLSVTLALVVARVDIALGDFTTGFLFPGPPEGARSFLGAIITAMISFTGLVFSITIVVLSLTSGQFSPRVLRGFLRDRVIQWSLGFFVASFVYAMMVDREVLGTNGNSAFVPRIAVTIAFVLVLGSVGVFIVYINHVANMIRVSSIIDRVATESTRLLEKRYPVDPDGQPAAPVLDRAVQTLAAPQRGVVVSVNTRELVDRAREADVVVRVVPRIGDFVPMGADLVVVYGGTVDDATAFTSAVSLDTERTSAQDLAFGFRQLVDVAEKALSPGINDPTTATQVLDILHDLLRRLVTRELRNGNHTDRDDRVRLVVAEYDFEDYLAIALAEIWHYGRDGTQIPERVLGTLEDLDSVARPEHRPAVRRWLDVVRRGQPAAEPV